MRTEEREGRGAYGRGKEGKGEGEREGRKGMAGPIPNPLLRVCYIHYMCTSLRETADFLATLVANVTAYIPIQ